jgi:RNA polymerase sigma-70 factor (ECF subfamily)
VNQQEQDFVNLYESHAGDVYAYCARRVGVHAAHDATADVYTVAWRRIDDLKPESGRQWLFGIARHVLKNQLRANARRSRLEAKSKAFLVDSTPGPETQVVRGAPNDAVIQALSKLREADREILRLAAWEELSGPEISETLGISLDACHQRLSRAKKRFAKALDPQHLPSIERQEPSGA